MKKLLFVWPNLEYGGGEIALINLLEQLKSKYIITLLCYENINKFSMPDGVSVVYASKRSKNKFGKIWNKILFFKKWLLLTKLNDLQIINEVPFMVIMARCISILTNKKYVLWVHSCRNEMGDNFSTITRCFYKYSLRTAENLVCVSNYCANSMAEYIGNKCTNMAVISNILRFKNMSDLIKLPSDFIKVCAVGRLTHEKNFLLLIESFSVAKLQTQEPVMLYICGEGEDRNILMNRVNQLKLNDSIILTGHVDNSISYINQCDIFVSSSNSEALPTVIFEALYCNKAIISTNTGAAEILENGKYGIVVERKNQNDFSNALIKLITDVNLREYYAKNTKQALNKFGDSEILKKWKTLLENNQI